MLLSSSKALTVVRANMWGFLLFAGVAWLAISWTVLRLEPGGVASVAGPVVLFGALTEVVRALAGTRTWWLNAGLAALFTVTGAVLLAGGESSVTAPAALVGWYLMVRGAVDVAVSMLTRESDRIWGLLMVVGVLEAVAGFAAASPFARTMDLAMTSLAGLALLRGVADLVTALRLRETAPPRTDLLELSPEREAGLMGYTAGLADYEELPAARSGPRHRADPHRPGVPLTPPAAQPHYDPGATVAATTVAPASGAAGAAAAAAAVEAAAVPEPASEPITESARAGEFHEEVLRTTADLDAMLALAGMTGAGVAAGMAEHHEIPEIPDTPEGAELTADTSEMAIISDEGKHRA